MAEPLRTAVVGVGWAGQRQVEASRELGRVIEVVALVDSDADHLAAVSAGLGIERTATDLDRVLAADDIEAISICTPHALHEPMAVAAASAGKHVLVEKPMATDVAAATRMLEAAGSAGVVLFVAEQLPYEARFDELRQIVRTGEHIGELTFAACVAGYRAASPSYAGRRSWLTDPEVGGTGTWVLQGIHTVAALRYVLGEARSVYLLDHRAASFGRPDLEATMSGVVVLDSGIVVSLTQTTETDLRPSLSGYRLYGDEGVVIADDDGYDVYRGDPRESGGPSRRGYPRSKLSPYAEELDAFARTVRGGDPGPTTGVSERRSLAVIEAGIESARTRQPVELRERFPDIWDDA